MPQNKCKLDFGQLFNEDAALYLSLFIIVAYDYFSRFAKPVSGGQAPAHPFKMAAEGKAWTSAVYPSVRSQPPAPCFLPGVPVTVNIQVDGLLQGFFLVTVTVTC